MWGSMPNIAQQNSVSLVQVGRVKASAVRFCRGDYISSITESVMYTITHSVQGLPAQFQRLLRNRNGPSLNVESRLVVVQESYLDGWAEVHVHVEHPSPHRLVFAL